MTGNYWKQLEKADIILALQEMPESGWNGMNMAGNNQKKLETAGYALKLVEMTGIVCK